MLPQISKTIAERFVFVDIDMYYTEPGSPCGNLFEGGAYSEGGLIRGGGSIESLRYALFPQGLGPNWEGS